MSNKVKYGLKNVYYAVATIDAATNTATYSAPVAWPGAVNLSLDAEGNTTKFRADNIDYWVGQSNNGYSGDFESALIPDSFRKDILGDIVPEENEGIMIEDAGAKTKYFALLFQFEGDENATRHVLYRCSAGKHEIASTTKDTTISPNEISVPITVGSRLSDGLVKWKCTEDKTTQYNAWNTAVYVPTFN